MDAHPVVPGSHRYAWRRRLRSAVAGLVLACAAYAAPGTAPAPAYAHPHEPATTLRIERVEFVGLRQTPLARALAEAGLELPAPATPEVIAEMIARVRESRLFASVEARTRPGEAPNQIVLVFDVRENRPHIRFGVGYEDFSSWYLIPAQLNADNLTGHGEQLALGARIGYRVSGLDLTLRRPSPRTALDFWELRAQAEHAERIYWLDSTETRHRLDRGGVEFRVGRRVAERLGLEGWLGIEASDLDSSAAVYADRQSRGRRKGDPVPFDSLPPQIRRDVGERHQSRLGLALTLDRRRGAGLGSRGTWARLSGEGAFSPGGDFASWQADVRGYAPLADGVQLAARVRAAALSANAPFHERYYVGGLYTVRGYPSQALSPPQGNLNLGAGSVELRSAWWGPASDPRVTAVAFVDVATGWNRTAPTARGLAWGAGFGFRVRLPWLGQAGFDVAHPLSDSPVDEAFHVNGVLGWTF